MSLIVQKFGGTSVADVGKIQAAARKAIRAQRQGHRVVMVVSAMGKNTDALLGLAGEIRTAAGQRWTCCSVQVSRSVWHWSH